MKYPKKIKVENKEYEREFEFDDLYKMHKKYVHSINEKYDRNIVVYVENKYYLGNRIDFQNVCVDQLKIRHLEDIALCQLLADRISDSRIYIKKIKGVKKISKEEAINLIHHNVLSNIILILEKDEIKTPLEQLDIDVKQYNDFLSLFKENIKTKKESLAFTWKTIIKNNYALWDIDCFLYDVIIEPLEYLLRYRVNIANEVFDDELIKIIFFKTKINEEILAKILYKCLTSKYIDLYI